MEEYHSLMMSKFTRTGIAKIAVKGDKQYMSPTSFYWDVLWEVPHVVYRSYTAIPSMCLRHGTYCHSEGATGMIEHILHQQNLDPFFVNG